jgi:hypothetical protein
MVARIAPVSARTTILPWGGAVSSGRLTESMLATLSPAGAMTAD